MLKVAQTQPFHADPSCHGWGRKRSGLLAVAQAQKNGCGFLLNEDGFLRSVGREDEALSIVVDDEGIYYDASEPSRLEKLIFQPLEATPKQRAIRLMERWRELRVSKYNAARDYARPLPEQYVLVIDQVAQDLSIEYGLADSGSFARMLHCALEENPESTIVVKMHPDIYTRKKAGHFDVQALEKMDRVQVIAENCHPVRLIEHAEAVYCVTSQVGFEALMWGKRVRCFGMPFYAGWGLTEDELPTPDRRGNATLEQLVHASLVEYPRYVDPERNEPCEVEETMEYIGLQRMMRSRFPETIFAYGFSKWKKPLVTDFFQGSEVRFDIEVKELPAAATVAVWGDKGIVDLPTDADVLRVEDGFLRSSGLGADLIRPLSWVIDDVGIYYDSSKPSRLEDILEHESFGEALLKRAAKLRGSLVNQGVGKYNLKGKAWKRPDDSGNIILIPGQVERDASIRHGAHDIKTNADLVKEVRSRNPEAYLVYKPHPDVVAGLRRKGPDEPSVEKWCDEVVLDADIFQLLEEVDEVHTMTSLTGFEALLRGIPVTCYGNPFYAGWGLTHDAVPLSRRTRKLILDELVAGTLILYPTYVSRSTEKYTTPERVVEELVEWRTDGPSKVSFVRRMKRSVLRTWAQSGLRKNA